MSRGGRFLIQHIPIFQPHHGRKYLEAEPLRYQELWNQAQPWNGTSCSQTNSPVWPQYLQLPPVFCPSQTFAQSQSSPTLPEVPVLFPAKHCQNNSLRPSLDQELNDGQRAVRSQWNVQSRFLGTWVDLAALG